MLFLTTIIIVLFARYANIYFLSWILNKYRSTSQITKEFKFFIWFAGFRGAMAFALSMKSTETFSERSVGKIMLTMTLLISIINVRYLNK